MGLTLFIMTIIVEAFLISLNSFQEFRAASDITAQARGALQIVRNDLTQDHFEGNRRLGDAAFWDTPRREGFFLIRQPTAPTAAKGGYILEGTDFDGNDAHIATDHVLHFSNRLPVVRREQVVSVSAPTTLTGGNLRQTNVVNLPYESLMLRASDARVNSPWCEIAYFLSPMKSGGVDVTILNDPDPPSYAPIKLYNLYRAQLLVFPYTDKVNSVVDFSTANLDSVRFLSCDTKTPAAGNKIRFLNPNDLAKGKRSFDPAAPDLARASLVCSNVISFQVRPMMDPPQNPGRLFDDLPTPGNFDSQTKPNENYRVVGLQVILRVYDPSTGLARQATIQQDL